MLFLGASTSLLAACGGSSPTGSTALTGTAPATTSSAAPALQQAARTMQGVASYTFTGSVTVASSSVRVGGEFQAPDRVHEVVTPSGGPPTELVLSGRRTFIRDPATGKWRPSSAGSSAADPRTAFSVLLGAEDVTRSGQEFHFRLPPAATSRLLAGAAPTRPASGTARVAGSMITALDISMAASGRAVTLTLSYGAIGTAPPVTTPSAAP